MSNKEGIIIVGLYHSGTTYLAKLLHDKGIKMHGDQGYYEEPETGMHYEDREIVELNRKEARVGIKVKQRLYKYNPTSKFKDNLRKYKNKRVAENVPWGFKEPRCAVLAKSYLDVFRNCKLILCHRSPHRVAMTRYNNYEGRQPFNSITNYEHTHAGVIDEWCLQKCQAKLFPFFHDGPMSFHQGQSDALNKFLDLDLNYVDGWKVDL